MIMNTTPTTVLGHGVRLACAVLLVVGTLDACATAFQRDRPIWAGTFEDAPASGVAELYIGDTRYETKVRLDLHAAAGTAVRWRLVQGSCKLPGGVAGPVQQMTDLVADRSGNAMLTRVLTMRSPVAGKYALVLTLVADGKSLGCSDLKVKQHLREVV